MAEIKTMKIVRLFLFTYVCIHHYFLCYRFMGVVEDSTHFLPLIIPVVVSRLGTNEITEPSEELR